MVNLRKVRLVHCKLALSLHIDLFRGPIWVLVPDSAAASSRAVRFCGSDHLYAFGW